MADMAISPSPSPSPTPHSPPSAEQPSASSSSDFVAQPQNALHAQSLAPPSPFPPRSAETSDVPPPSPSSASQSDGGELEGAEADADGDGFADSFNISDRRTTFRGTIKTDLPRPSSLVPQSPASAGESWVTATAFNSNPLSPANLPHEILLHIFKFLLTRTTGHAQLRNCLEVCRSWCLCGVELLWHRPAFTHVSSFLKLVNVIRSPAQTFPYVTFIRRLNFSGITDDLVDPLFLAVTACTRLERLSMAHCNQISEDVLCYVLSSLRNLISIDLSDTSNVSDRAIKILAENCKRLQGLNLSNCKHITSKGVAALGEKCSLLRRIKFNGCILLDDEGVVPIIRNCAMLLEIDLFNCPLIGDGTVRHIWYHSTHVRDLRLAGCGPLTDTAFPAPARMLTNGTAALDLGPSPAQRFLAQHEHSNGAFGAHGSDSAPASRGTTPIGGARDDSSRQRPGSGMSGLSRTLAASYLSTPLRPPKSFEHMRILDLSNCSTISDDAIEGIIANAPRIRNLLLSKCTRLTDESLINIAKLGKNLQHLHLGHCSNITDRGVRHLVDRCSRLRFLDLACCSHLTDLSVTELAAKLPRIKRIGLVRVHQITDASLYALVERHLTLQRIHLSYCDNISVPAVFWLLERLPKVTHISLTGVNAFRRPELQRMCRPAPEEFSQHQRESFCVYSGQGVTELQKFLRSVYSSEESATAFHGGAEITPEVARAIQLVKEHEERSLHGRRLHYRPHAEGSASRRYIWVDANGRRIQDPHDVPPHLMAHYNARLRQAAVAAGQSPGSHDHAHRGGRHRIDSAEGSPATQVTSLPGTDLPEPWRSNPAAAAGQGWPPAFSADAALLNAAQMNDQLQIPEAAAHRVPGASQQPGLPPQGWQLSAGELEEAARRWYAQYIRRHPDRPRPPPPPGWQPERVSDATAAMAGGSQQYARLQPQHHSQPPTATPLVQQRHMYQHLHQHQAHQQHPPQHQLLHQLPPEPWQLPQQPAVPSYPQQATYEASSSTTPRMGGTTQLAADPRWQIDEPVQLRRSTVDVEPSSSQRGSSSRTRTYADIYHRPVGAGRGDAGEFMGSGSGSSPAVIPTDMDEEAELHRAIMIERLRRAGPAPEFPSGYSQAPHLHVPNGAPNGRSTQAGHIPVQPRTASGSAGTSPSGDTVMLPPVGSVPSSLEVSGGSFAPSSVEAGASGSGSGSAGTRLTPTRAPIPLPLRKEGDLPASASSSTPTNWPPGATPPHVHAKAKADPNLLDASREAAAAAAADAAEQARRERVERARVAAAAAVARASRTEREQSVEMGGYGSGTE